MRKDWKNTIKQVTAIIVMVCFLVTASRATGANTAVALGDFIVDIIGL